VDKASAAAQPKPARSWQSGNLPVVLWFIALVLIVALLVLGAQIVGKKVLSFLARPSDGTVTAEPASASDSALQSEAEQLLERAAHGDGAASDQVLARSERWIGKTQRTATANQLLTVALNSRDMHAREAAIQADLALDGVPWNATGLNTLERAVGDPRQRVWALWTLGALGNRGVDPAHTAKIIEAYLSDPDADVRAAAVSGLALLASDETVPMLLDRFRNDPSPVVQERAACGLAQAGMYTNKQRMIAAASMVNWLDDPLMTTQQRTWAVQALRDISGQDFGAGSAAWRQWYENTR